MELYEKFEWAHQALSFYDYEQAEKLAWEIREEKPDLAAVYLLLGNIYTNTGRHQEAVNAFQQAVELDLESVEGYNNLGIAYRKTGHNKESLKAFQKAHELQPERADISYNLANCHKQLHNHESAERLYREALKIDPSFLMAYNNLGTLYQQNGETSKAVDLYERGLAYDPNHPTLHYNMGRAQENLGNFEQAIKEYRRSLKSKPGWSSALNNLGVVLQKVDRHQEAEQTFTDLLKIEPKNYQAYNNIGVLLAAQEKYEEAEEFFKKSLSINANYQSAVVNLGKMYVESGEEGKAQEKLQSILNGDPDNHDIRFEYAALLLKQGKANAALHHILRLLHIDQNNADYLLLLGRTRHKLGSNEKAVPPLERALKIRGHFEAALIELAFTLADLERHDEAGRKLDLYLKKNPDSLNVMITRAEIELDAKNFDRALTEFQDLNKTYPNNELILKGLLTSFQKLGNREEALRIAEELVHLFGNPELSEDFDKLEAGLQLYEQIIGELADEKQTNWQANLRQILQSEELESDEKLDSYIHEMAAESDEDIEGEMVPIIDVGGIEPVIAVNEEDGDPISLIDMEEDIEPPEEEIDEEEPEKLSAAVLIENETSGGQGTGDNSAYPQYPQQPAPQFPAQPTQYPQQSAPQYQQYPQQPVPQDSPRDRADSSAPQQQTTSQTQAQEEPAAPPVQPQFIPYPVYQQRPAADSQTGSPDSRPASSPPGAKNPEASPENPPPELSADEENHGNPLYPQDMDTLEDALQDDEAAGSGEEHETGIDQSSAQGLFDYLTRLVEYLPDEEKTHYEESDMRLRVEALRSRLKGKGGLHAIADRLKKNNGSIHTPTRADSPPADTEHRRSNHESALSSGLLHKTDKLEPDSIRSAFSYLQGLSEDLPNPSIGVALKRKMHDIIEKLQD